MEKKNPIIEFGIRILKSKIFWFFLIIFVAVFLIQGYVAERILVQGESMEPTLQNGDMLLIEKRTYAEKEPERYDVVVATSEATGTKQQYVKRIIGLPGETIKIKKGFVFINGEQLEEPVSYDLIEDGGMARNKMELGDDEYFLLGDNRNESKDSRHVEVGIIKKEQIKGKVWLRILPLNKIGNIEKITNEAIKEEEEVTEDE